MKTIHLALISLGAAMLVAGCGGSSGGTTPPVTPVSGKVTITNVNADAVAKGGMTPSQATAKTGSGGASIVGVVVQPGAPRQSVMDIALAQLRRVEGLKLPAAPAGVVGASISPFPITFGCGLYAGTSNPVIPGFTAALVSTSGTMAIDLVDTNINGKFDNGDVASVTFTACVDQTTTMNGGFSLTINSQTGGVLNTNTGKMEGTSGSPLIESVAMSFSNFSVVDTAPNPDETILMNGGMTLSVTDNGTTLSSTMSGTSFAMTSSTDGTFTLKGTGSGNFAITYTEDSPSATSPTGNYSFSVSMTTDIANLGTVTGGVTGSVVITTTTPFTGNGVGEPTAGVMVITGANNSNLTLTAKAPNGTYPNGYVVMVVTDTSTTPSTVTTSNVTWDTI